MLNEGNYIISLSDLCKFLAKQAEDLGCELYPGFAAVEALYNDKNQVIGVATGSVGIDKNEMEVTYGTKKYVLVHENGKATVKDADGKIIAIAISDTKGNMNLVDADGKVLSTYSNEEVTSMLEAK